MDDKLKKKFIRLIYAKALRYLGIALVICAVLGSALGKVSESIPRSVSETIPSNVSENTSSGSAGLRTYFIFALCAAGGFFLAWGWFTYLASTGMRVPGFGKLPERGKRVPYMYRKNKSEHHKPAFLMTAEDYDDDLNDQVSLSEDDFTAAQQQKIRQWARLACSALLFLSSFFIK